MTRLGYQIPNFTYPDTPPERLFDTVAAQAAAADRSGFDTVLLMDHFYQLPMLGQPDANMLECYTTLGALARETKNVRLGALVTGNTYRNPTLLAKIDHRARRRVGRSRAARHRRGLVRARARLARLRVRHVLRPLREARGGIADHPADAADESVPLDGEHYTVKDTINHPAPLSKIPVMIGGSGEKKTLRMVAQYADQSNLTCPLDEVPRKLDALAAHCERLGRDRSEIAVSKHINVGIADTHDQAYAELAPVPRRPGSRPLDDGRRDQGAHPRHGHLGRRE